MSLCDLQCRLEGTVYQKYISLKAVRSPAADGYMPHGFLYDHVVCTGFLRQLSHCGCIWAVQQETEYCTEQDLALGRSRADHHCRNGNDEVMLRDNMQS